MRKFTADFETTTSKDDCRVWAWGTCEIGNPSNFEYGNDIRGFIEFCKTKDDNYLLYFHNLKFDGEYIFYYLLNNGYEYIHDKKDRKDNTFTSLISDAGQFYSIEIYFDCSNKKHINKATIYDSLKILNFSVDKIAKAFNLDINKLEIDYHEIREIGHILTDHEVDYLRNDVEIMARALENMFDQDLTKMTIGSNALASYKKMNKNFKSYFPILSYEVDNDIRKAYKGGFTYLNPYYKDKEVGSGSVFDVNSLYPSVMYNDPLPFGEPIFFEGEYIEDRLYPLYVQMITCTFKLKEGKIPTIQIKNSLAFMPNAYLESSDDDLVTLTLTSVDIKLFFDHYDVTDITYHSGWKFKAIKGLFRGYIDKWTEEKIKAKKEGNNSLYLIAKLMLNSLYGKFGLNPNVRSKFPYMNENGVVKYKMGEKEVRDPIYIPLASFITSYARLKTISTSQLIRDFSKERYGEDYYIYSDTDSIHCLITNIDELGELFEIDEYKLGAWDHENNFTRAKFIRQKCYIEEIVGADKLNVTVAGLPKRLSHKLNFKNFKQGFETDGKLTFKHVKGGVILEDTTFTIK